MESAVLIKRASCAISLVFLLVSPAFSGPLNGDPAAIAPIWTGTTAFSNVNGLNGTVDFAVYSYAAFESEWGGLGYSPTPGELVYTYQVLTFPNSLNVSQLSVAILNPADNPGSFALGGGQGPSSVGLGDWGFSPEIPGNPANASSGLAFSSPYSPIDLLGTLTDGGSHAYAIPLPSPGSSMIPEPATISLLFMAALSWLPTAIRRVRK